MQAATRRYIAENESKFEEVGRLLLRGMPRRASEGYDDGKRPRQDEFESEPIVEGSHNPLKRDEPKKDRKRKEDKQKAKQGQNI